ncbi:glycosyl hydrolase [Caldicellulosiruptoraceae bacterium PP1]
MNMDKEVEILLHPKKQMAINNPDENYIEFECTLDTDNEFNLIINYKCLESFSSLLLHINGYCYGDFGLFKNEQHKDINLASIKLNKGTNLIKIERRWGSPVEIKYIKLLSKKNDINIRPNFELSNKKANDECKRLMEYFSNIYSNKIIAGQHTNSAVGPEMAFIKYKTGQMPALRGFDFLSYTSNTITNDMSAHGLIEVEINKGSVEAAIKWNKDYGGIVTFCWHWYAPTGGIDKTFYTKNTDFDVERALITGTKENELLINDIRMIAEQLKRLDDLNIPVLWRPLHEADGRWFWWGAKGPDPYKKLYYLLYDILVNHYKLNNLIWVWNAPQEEWVIDSDYFDIAGVDMYAPQKNYGPLRINYEKICELTSYKKPVTLSENGPIPDPEILLDTKTYWLWFMPWFGDFVLSENFSTFEHLKYVYNHENVITLDKFDLFRK